MDSLYTNQFRLLYRVSHSRVAPENVGLQKEQKYNTFACHTCNKVRLCVLGIHIKKLATQKEMVVQPAETRRQNTAFNFLVKKLETKGTLLDLHGGGRPEMSENTVHDVANRLLASPRNSLCVLSQKIGLSRSTCQRARARSGCSPVTHRVGVVHIGTPF
jgi:hypothetical protein